MALMVVGNIGIVTAASSLILTFMERDAERWLDDLLLAVLGVSPGSEDVRHLLTHVLVDPRRGRYPGGLSSRALAARGVRVVEAELVTPVSSPAIDPERTVARLRSLC